MSPLHLLVIVTLFGVCSAAHCQSVESLRLATYNASLYGQQSGEIRERLSDGVDEQAARIASIIQTVRPDILLVNEIDHDEGAVTAKLLAEKFINFSQGKLKPIKYPYVYSAPSNTGIASGIDLDGDGETSGPGDAWGYGAYPGQYSMAVLSRFPIDVENIRTFQKLRWRDFPNALRPTDPTSGSSYYDDRTWDVLRLSSKNHIDVPVMVGDHVIHVLASHPTPPVFDGPEDRNGCRNHDEIRFWNEYIDRPDASFLVDDQGRAGGLPVDQHFFIAGDLNSDPYNGDSRDDGIVNLLRSPRLTDPQPRSNGGGELDTADFGRNGNMRIDYVLPSRSLRVRRAEVFWPGTNDPQHDWISASDHRMVWVDVTLTP